nr:hypothetical protein CFP56_51757 [Quercus suber]
MGTGVMNFDYDSEKLYSLEESSSDDDIGDDTDENSEDELKTPRLLQTFIDNWPQYEHRICCKHLYNNLKKNHPVVLIRNLFWKAAKTTYKAKFDRLMDELKGIDEDAHSWLQDHSTTI